jgi:hypothetical protein
MKQVVTLLLCCLLLTGCHQEPEIRDYTDDILGIWYAVEYDEYVEFLADGTVEDTYNETTTRGFWKLDNTTAQLWINFGDDIFSIRISEQDGKMILLDNNGTLVREADRDAAREAYQTAKNAD